MKMSFMLWPMLYIKSPNMVNINDVEFIRSLPKKLTRIYVIHFYFSMIIAFFACSLAVMLYAIK
jgi:hypothetical protein